MEKQLDEILDEIGKGTKEALKWVENHAKEEVFQTEDGRMLISDIGKMCKYHALIYLDLAQLELNQIK